MAIHTAKSTEKMNVVLAATLYRNVQSVRLLNVAKTMGLFKNASYKYRYKIAHGCTLANISQVEEACIWVDGLLARFSCTVWTLSCRKTCAFSTLWPDALTHKTSGASHNDTVALTVSKLAYLITLDCIVQIPQGLSNQSALKQSWSHRVDKQWRKLDRLWVTVGITKGRARPSENYSAYSTMQILFLL